MDDDLTQKRTFDGRLGLGLAISVFGLAMFVLGLTPGFFGLDRSPVVGFVQIAVFRVGLAIICLGGYLTLTVLWGRQEKTIAADIGYRTVATGYVVAAASGMADVFGFGSQPFPSTPYFGQWQALGVMIGEIFIIIGFLLMIPYPIKKSTHSPE
jgi:hypothetical protein